jgi:probable biosynthetic protein (TIGR04098 family)
MLRHFGDVHWRLICDDLGVRSAEVVDHTGDRLYASFVRARWTASAPLSDIRESDELSAKTDMVRAGPTIFMSSSRIKAGSVAIDLRLASSFARRNRHGRNDRLLAAIPMFDGRGYIPNVQRTPEFIQAHRLLRKDSGAGVELLGETMSQENCKWETVEYELTGYYDFNGAKLLYFASYATIADICLSKTSHAMAIGGRYEFVTSTAPSARDIFFFGNADLFDSLIGAVARSESKEKDRYVIALRRRSDNECISLQFCVRQKGGERWQM